ncbi:hypothetical protein FS594_27630 (plasmid) [Rahnella aquatilis]|nr:hypothetical protein FS594_27630 [Rahnella aquatilis]
MKPKLSFAVLFIFITFGAMAKDMTHVKSPSKLPQGGFNNHNAFADTAEVSDEHIREDHHRTIRRTS